MSSFALHVLAMILMTLDHLGGTIFPYDILNCIGRIAFPIFAFMIAEGFFHTHDFKKYLKRMVIFAIIAEVPFDLMMYSTFFFPFYQNVLWTFVIALILMKWIDSNKDKGMVRYVLVSITAVIAGLLVGTVTCVDYYGFGVLTVLVFYFFHGKKWWCYLGQLACLVYIYFVWFKGYYYDLNIGSFHYELQQESLAVLGLIPIWLYNGKQGYHAKWFKYFCYAFYPAHILVIYLIWTLVN